MFHFLYRSTTQNRKGTDLGQLDGKSLYVATGILESLIRV